jgi:hypothetical protein
MAPQNRLIELPPSAFKADASSTVTPDPIRHLRVFLALQGYDGDIREVALGNFVYAGCVESVKRWLQGAGMPPDVNMIPMPKLDRRLPRGYALVPVQAVEGQVRT